MTSYGSPPESNFLLESLRDYLEQLREEGLEGLPGNALQSEGKPLPLSAARPSHMSESPGPRLSLRRETPADKSVTREVAASSQPIRSGERADVRSPSSGIENLERAPRESRAGGLAPDERTPPHLFHRYPGLEKTANLDDLRTFIGDCTRCKLAPMRTNLVFGVGNPNADLMFVGEAPGADEDARGEPFVGRAGQLLTDIIERGMGLKREDVYICNVIKCRPPGNRNPENDEVASCEPFLFRQIDLVKPRAIVGLGTFAVQALLKVKTPISKLRGNWHEVHGVRLMPTFHPAYLLRNAGDKRLVWADIQLVMKELGMPIPNRGGRV